MREFIAVSAACAIIYLLLRFVRHMNAAWESLREGDAR